MERQNHESTCDAIYLIKPKEELPDDLVHTDNCEDDTDVIIPKEELSNTSLHLDDDLSEQKVDIGMPIKTELILSDSIAQLRRQYELSEHGRVSKDMCIEIEIKVEPKSEAHDCMPTHGEY
nr:uncharacterized protein LOC117994934 [Maniola hyperantus]